MLSRLTIQHYGLIPQAEIAFSKGATIFTGETGSGKTMVLGAMAFVLGERTGTDVIRRGQSHAVVTLEFDADAALRERFAADGFALDPDENATIVREISAESGKSSIRLNGRAANAGYVREIAAQIVDIAGQHEAQRLLSPGYHVELLDRFGGDTTLQAREKVAELHARRAQIIEALQDLDRDERRAQEQYAFAQFALEEIEAAAPRADEDEQLRGRQRVLDNMEKVTIALRTAHESLAGDRAAADSLGSASSALAQISDVAAPFAEMAAAAQALQSEAGDLGTRVSRELEDLEFDAGELEAINSRLDALERLKRKYGGSIESVLQSVQNFRSTLELFENKDERKTQLQKDLQQATSELDEAAQHLSRLRHAAADRLRKAVEREFKDLALPSARFGTAFEPLAEIGAGGAESLQFVFAANKGEPERPLAKVASGGELSRVLLALIVVLAAVRARTALIFDEVDAGIGGATATAVGIRLGRLAAGAQVICVTHLAQIASWADAHYALEKRENRNATTIEVRRIDGERDRAAELARMLSGEAHDVALKHARTLLKQTGERRLAV